MTPHLSKGAVKAIGQHVDGIFDGVKARMLGPDFYQSRKSILFHQQPYSLPGLYVNAAADEMAAPNKLTLVSLAKVAENYLDAQRELTKARVLHAVNAWLASPDERPIEEVLGASLSDVWKRLNTEIVKIANSEGTAARNLGTLEGVVKINAAAGVKEPVVAFVGPRDQYTCEECIRVLCMPDRITPRAFWLSEVSHDYHERGSDTPCIGGMHPHCRHSLVTIMPGYGFDEGGKIKYRGKGYSVLEDQRSQPAAPPPAELK